MTLCKLISISM